MTIDEAKIFIQNAMEQSRNALAELMLIMPKVFAVKRKSLGEYYSNLENCKKEIQACEVAVKALEEIQQYRKHGITVESALDNMCDLAAAENLIEEYRAIGTPEECLRNKDFLRFLANSMNQKKYETYLRIYNAVEKDGRDGKVGGVDGN